jgi:hypothetical protein
MAETPARNELAVKGSANDQPTVARAVQLVRQQLYANTAAERDTIAAVDRQAQESVQAYEKILITRATGEAARLKETADEAESVAEQLQEITKAARRGDEIDLQKWSQLDVQAQRLTELAVASPDRMADLLEMLDDPLQALSTLQLKYPSLPRPIHISR